MARVPGDGKGHATDRPQHAQRHAPDLQPAGWLRGIEPSLGGGQASCGHHAQPDEEEGKEGGERRAGDDSSLPQGQPAGSHHAAGCTDAAEGECRPGQVSSISHGPIIPT